MTKHASVKIRRDENADTLGVVPTKNVASSNPHQVIEPRLIGPESIVQVGF